MAFAFFLYVGIAPCVITGSTYYIKRAFHVVTACFKHTSPTYISFFNLSFFWCHSRRNADRLDFKVNTYANYVRLTFFLTTHHPHSHTHKHKNPPSRRRVAGATRTCWKCHMPASRWAAKSEKVPSDECSSRAPITFAVVRKRLQ